MVKIFCVSALIKKKSNNNKLKISFMENFVKLINSYRLDILVYIIYLLGKEVVKLFPILIFYRYATVYLYMKEACIYNIYIHNA